MKKIISFFLLFIIITTYSSAFYTALPVWYDDQIAEVNAESSDNFLELESESAILIDASTGNILYEKSPHEILRPASVTKIMSILLIMEALDRGDITLDTQVPCSESASSMGGSQIWLDSTETLSVNEMLKAICVVSANDCTYAMAEFLAGSENLFVQKMNERAKELGMNDTTFKNCHGIDEDGHVTSSYDIALMSRELITKHPEITNYTTIWMDSLRDGKSELVNTNKLIRTYEGITGLKTGSTSLALYNLSATATRNDLSLIAVVMRAPTAKIRFKEAKLLLDYGFNTYEYKKIANKGDLFQSITVSKGITSDVNLIFEKDSGILKKKSNTSEISQDLVLNDNIEAPVIKDSVLGTINYYLDNNLIDSVNLVAESDIPRKSLWNTFNYIGSSWLNMLKKEHSNI